jgi:hypothetical protein
MRQVQWAILFHNNKQLEVVEIFNAMLSGIGSEMGK